MEGSWRLGKKTLSDAGSYSASYQGKLWFYCAGNHSLQSFDPSSSKWEINSINPEVEGPGMVIISGTIYFGGIGGLHTYSILSNEWGFCPIAGNDLRGSFVYPGNGTLFYILTEENIYSYDAGDGELIKRSPPLVKNKNGCSYIFCAMIGNYIFYTQNYENRLQIYDIATDKWSIEQTDFDCYFPVLVAFEGSLVVIDAGLPAENTVKTYDPVSKEWSVGPKMVMSMSGDCCAAVINKNIYVIDQYGVMQIFGPETSGTVHTITHQFLDAQGSLLQPPTTRTVADGQPYSVTAPTVDGYLCAGFRMDGGALQGGATASIAAVRADHTVTFVYKADDGTDPGPGPGPGPGDGEGKCCTKIKIQIESCVCNDPQKLRELGDLIASLQGCDC